jgi:CHASE3 domain sensor protein
MDWPAEKYGWLSLLSGLALIFAWGVISLAHAHERSLASVDDSFTQGSMIMEGLGGVSADLDRLAIDQRAFLSTGDLQFQDGVIESSEALLLQMSRLQPLAAKNRMQPSLLADLQRWVDRALGSVGESDTVAARRGRAAAMEFFEDRGAAIWEARAQADHLKALVGESISDRIRNARSARAFLHDLVCIAPPGTELKSAGRKGLIRPVSRAESP